MDFYIILNVSNIISHGLYFNYVIIVKLKLKKILILM